MCTVQNLPAKAMLVPKWLPLILIQLYIYIYIYI